MNAMTRIAAAAVLLTLAFATPGAYAQLPDPAPGSFRPLPPPSPPPPLMPTPSLPPAAGTPPLLGAPAPRESFGDKVQRCIHYGSSHGIGPGEIGPYTRDCVNRP